MQFEDNIQTAVFFARVAADLCYHPRKFVVTVVRSEGDENAQYECDNIRLLGGRRYRLVTLGPYDDLVEYVKDERVQALILYQIIIRKAFFSPESVKNFAREFVGASEVIAQNMRDQFFSNMLELVRKHLFTRRVEDILRPDTDTNPIIDRIIAQINYGENNCE